MVDRVPQQRADAEGERGRAIPLIVTAVAGGAIAALWWKVGRHDA